MKSFTSDILTPDAPDDSNFHICQQIILRQKKHMHGDLYKQGMKTCTSTRITGVKSQIRLKNIFWDTLLRVFDSCNNVKLKYLFIY